MRARSIAPARRPMSAKASDTPPSVSATGYPAIRSAQTAITMRTARNSATPMAASGRWRPGCEHQCGPQGLGDALQRQEEREQRNQRLEQEHGGQAARFARAFEDRPGARRIRQAEEEEGESERHQQQHRAEEVDQ